MHYDVYEMGPSDEGPRLRDTVYFLLSRPLERIYQLHLEPVDSSEMPRNRIRDAPGRLAQRVNLAFTRKVLDLC